MGNITISLVDLGLFILFVLGGTAAVFLIMALNNINNAVKKVNRIMDAESEDFIKTAAMLPGMVCNINSAADSFKLNADKIGSIAGSVEETVAETVTAVSGKTQDVLEIARIVGAAVKLIIKAFSKSDV